MIVHDAIQRYAKLSARLVFTEPSFNLNKTVSLNVRPSIRRGCRMSLETEGTLALSCTLRATLARRRKLRARETLTDTSCIGKTDTNPIRPRSVQHQLPSLTTFVLQAKPSFGLDFASALRCASVTLFFIGILVRGRRKTASLSVFLPSDCVPQLIHIPISPFTRF